MMKLMWSTHLPRWSSCSTNALTAAVVLSLFQPCVWWSQRPSTRSRRTAFTWWASGRAPTVPPTSWPGSASPWLSSAASCIWCSGNANKRPTQPQSHTPVPFKFVLTEGGRHAWGFAKLSGVLCAGPFLTDFWFPPSLKTQWWRRLKV